LGTFTEEECPCPRKARWTTPLPKKVGRAGGATAALRFA
jgi:hypothetical protein